jgi:hypothetical protein
LLSSASECLDPIPRLELSVDLSYAPPDGAQRHRYNRRNLYSSKTLVKQFENPNLLCR